MSAMSYIIPVAPLPLIITTCSFSVSHPTLYCSFKLIAVLVSTRSISWPSLLFLLTVLVVAAAVGAEANAIPPVSAPAPSPATYPTEKFSFKLILHNVFHKNVTFKLVTPVVTKTVVALPNKWNAITPALLSTKRRTVGVSVTVQTDKHATVTKIFTIYLLQHFKASELKGEKFLLLTAVKSWSWKSKYLLITIGDDIVLSIKL